MKLKSFVLLFVFVALLLSAVVVSTDVQAGTNNEKACWGQASALFAKMKTLNPPLSDMGEHSSSFSTPRAGLRNLARELFKAELIPDDSMQSLGSFVEAELGLSIEACVDLNP